MENNTFIIGDVHGHHKLLKKLYVEAGITGEPVVQIGDLGHFGLHTKDDDLACYRFAYKKGMHLIWGNHDRATVSPAHSFGGYSHPFVETQKFMGGFVKAGRYHLANNLNGSVDAIVDYIGQGGAILDDISYLRGGLSDEGGILWRDARESLYDGVPQVFGHSASRIGYVHGEKDKWWNVDIGVKEHKKLAGIWLPSQEIVQVGA